MTPYTLINDSSPEHRNTHTHVSIEKRFPDLNILENLGTVKQHVVPIKYISSSIIYSCIVHIFRINLNQFL